MDIEIKFKAGDSLQIPEGCKAIVKDNVVVFEKAFQNGDVLHSMYDNEILIFKSYTNDERFSSHYNSSGMENSQWKIDAFRHATEEEKQTLFDKMKEQGLRWNNEEKQVEKIRWSAGAEDMYYFVYPDLTVQVEYSIGDLSESYYLAGNYLRTEEQAIEVAKRIKETLLKYHEEIGE